MITKEMFSKIDIDLVSRHIQWMVDNTPYRIAGSNDEKRAVAHVVETMYALGMDVIEDIFYTYNSYPKHSKLELVYPHVQELESLPFAHINSTSLEGSEFELLYVGNGNYSDYDCLEPTGKIVLVEVSYAPPVPEKARIAKEMGAAGIICMNWGNDEKVICNRGLKAVWGNPTERTLGNMPNIIGLGVTRTDGLMLKGLCQEGIPVKIRAASISKDSWSLVNQPIGIIRGAGRSKQFIVVGSHIDAWCPGVTCNATGNATAVELARILSQYKDQLDRDIWFVFWNGHEIAEAAGSTWFADNYWNELNKNCVAYVNIDSTGMREATLYEIKSSDELHDYTYNIASEIVGSDIRMMYLPKIGDQSFFGIGIPSVAQRMSFTEEYIKNGNGVTLGWWNHTYMDSFDKYCPENIEKDIKVHLSLLAKLSIVPLLPYKFDRFFNTAIQRLQKARKISQDSIDLAPLAEQLERASQTVLTVQARSGEITTYEARVQYNKFLLAVSRKLNNVFKTYTDKYQQDSYGFSKLASPVPLLADLDRLTTLKKNSFESGLIETQIVKNCNRISDALYDVCELSELYTVAIFGKL